MRNKEVQERMRQAFDHAAPELPGMESTIRMARETPAPARRRNHPAIGYAMGAAAAVLVFFCGFAILHGRGARSSGPLTAAAQVPLATPTPAPVIAVVSAVPTATAEPLPTATAAPRPTVGPATIEAALLGEEEAKALALENAGVQADQAKVVRVEMDREDGRLVYEVEFVAGGVEYDYELDAYTGEILKSEREKVQPPKSTAKPKSTSKATARPTAKPSEASSADIGRDKALSIALGNAVVSSEAARKVKVEKDRENGRTVYEVDFEAGGYEYEYEIDAASGKILKKEKERDDD